MTVAEAIKALGGTAELAAALGVVPSAVRNWRRLNAFPKRLYLDISQIAKRRRVRLDPSLFCELSVPQRQERDARARVSRSAQVAAAN